MKFSIEIDDDVLAACDAEIKELGSLIRSRSHYIELVLSIRHGMIKLDALSKIDHAVSEKPKLQRAGRAARG